MHINISKIDFGRCDSGVVPQLNGMYITPASDTSISVTPNDSYYTLHGKHLKYSLNGKKWNDWERSVTIEPGQKMYLKGEDDYVWNISTNDKLITSNGIYNVGGDISSLTNEIVEVKSYTFYNLFLNDSYIKDASNLILPAETLADYCYSVMFSGCSSLTTAPALPATTLAYDCYSNMFIGCTSLTAAPELPATTLKPNCYLAMFQGCTSLTAAPELPATTLANYCYSRMFSGCTSLTAAPELPATTLANYCYQQMFSGCTSLTAAPELTATTLATECYSRMFSGCTSLTATPELPATTLADSCYSSMFSICTSLTTAPELPATTLANYCYQEMFQGCKSLTAAPELPATTLASDCYSYMFQSCTSLTTAPELPATTLASDCYQKMFAGCTSLNSITMLATDISAPNCLYNWVEGVASTGTFTKAASMTSLPTGISGIPTGWTVADYTDYMTISALGDGEITITIPAEVNSSYATYLSYSKDKSSWSVATVDDTEQTITIPVSDGEDVYLRGEALTWFDSELYAGLSIDSTANIDASGNIMSLLYGDDYNGKTSFTEGYNFNFSCLFSENEHLINAEHLVLPATTLTEGCYSNMFSYCTSLTTAPKLPATTLAQLCYENMFSSCTSLTTAPELPATTLAPSCYNFMFADCTSLTTAPELPATTLASDCYSYMFSSCTSLTTAPELPATTLAESCYNSMFSSCISLTTAPELPATTLAESCYNSMFMGCTSLTTSPELPAATLVSSCYGRMFNSCSSLNNITMLATDISASGCLLTWVEKVSSTGTFTKAASMTTLTSGASGIPEGWTVKDYGAVDYSSEYMTLSALGDGEITITIPAGINSTYATSLSYSKDKSTWNETLIDDTTQTINIPVTSGENVYLKGIANEFASGVTKFSNINSTADINASGNIMSLLYGDDYKDKVELKTGTSSTFSKLFKDNTHLINAENLILQATTLKDNCYSNMFQGCSSLTTAPSLPATNFKMLCYSHMFEGCASLTTAPELPATNLIFGCYLSMFSGCSSLTTAPSLPATTLVSSCYKSMFLNCNKLNSITMLATDISAKECLDNWVSGVASTGTFTKASSASIQSGVSGIPEGWTVVDYGAA